MTIAADRGVLSLPLRKTAPSYLGAQTTVRSWALTTDHKRIGVLYLVTVVLMLALGGAFALAMRVKLVTPDASFVSATTYSRLFTLHGVTMVWLFMIPSIPAAFGNFLVPIMIGAKEVAFPRLNLTSY